MREMVVCENHIGPIQIKKCAELRDASIGIKLDQPAASELFWG